MLTIQQIEGTILGLAAGDALGVPVEGKDEAYLERHAVSAMLGYGVHGMPPGTWSDDTSLCLATMDSIARTDTIDFDDLLHTFQHWADDGAFPPAGHAFGIGATTKKALEKYRHHAPALQAGGVAEQNNGNGSLVRITPLTLYLYGRHGTDINEHDLNLIQNVSALTHRHPRAKMACVLLVLLGLNLLDGAKPLEALTDANQRFHDYYWQKEPYHDELWHFERSSSVQAFYDLAPEDIGHSGYVIDTLETAVWCLLHTENYRNCVTRAVNLGGKTDSNGAVAGALAGMRYGIKAIPHGWLMQLVRRDYIEDLCHFFGRNLTR